MMVNVADHKGSEAGNALNGHMLDWYRLSLVAANRSPKTVSWYLEILTRYFSFLQSHHFPGQIQQLGRDVLKAYVLHLQESVRWANSPHIKKAGGKLSPYSVQGHVRAIKAFWSWLAAEDYIQDNPLAKFPLPKVPQNLVKVLTQDQIKTLLAQIDRTTPMGAKYFSILLLLLDTGARISEVVSLQMHKLNLHDGCIEVLGKGQKQRLVPFSKGTRKQILHYLSHCRGQICSSDSPYLFPTPDGGRISSNSVQQYLRRLAKTAGLSGVKCSPHIFRHTFATQALANGANVIVLRDIMGHSSLTTTLKYTHLQPADLQSQHAKFSPVEHLGLGQTNHKKPTWWVS